MRIPSVLFPCVMLLLLPVATAAQPAAVPTPMPAEPLVIASGTGTIQAAPDRAFVMIGAESRAAIPRLAQQQNAQAMTAVQQRIRAAGIPADAVRTVGYDLQQEVDFVTGKRVVRGYVARNSLEVRVDAIERLGDVIDASVAAGATNVNGIRFDLKDRVKSEREALRLAVADARAKAEAMAAGAGLTLGRVVRLDEQGGFEPPPRPMMAMRAEAAQVASTPVEPGTIELRATVTLTASLR